MTWSGISAARARLERLARGLHEAGNGAVLKRAAEKVGNLVRKVAASKLAAHQMSGAAASATVVDVAGGLIQLHGMPSCNGKKWEGKSYLGTFSWWPFRGGVMPPFVVTQAQLIFALELLLVLGGRGSALGSVAGDVIDEADARAARRALPKPRKPRRPKAKAA